MDSIQLKLSSVNKRCLTLYFQFMLNLLKHYKIIYKINFLPTKKKRITFLKSSHVNKRSQEHFSVKKFGAFITLTNQRINGNLLKQIVVDKPSSIQIKIKLQRG